MIFTLFYRQLFISTKNMEPTQICNNQLLEGVEINHSFRFNDKAAQAKFYRLRTANLYEMKKPSLRPAFVHCFL